MDKEIFYINSILVETDEGLTTSEISKLLFEKFNIKVSRQIVKNYLWSYFRNIIEYNKSEFSYKLSKKSFLSDDIFVQSVEKSPRMISANFKNGKLELSYDKSKSIEDLVKAIGVINFSFSQKKKQTDLIKQINRIIEQDEPWEVSGYRINSEYSW